MSAVLQYKVPSSLHTLKTKNTISRCVTELNPRKYPPPPHQNKTSRSVFIEFRNHEPIERYSHLGYDYFGT